MDFEPVKRAWIALPTPYRIAAVIVVLIALALASSSAGLAVSRWKDRRFDKAEAKATAERQQLELERDASIRRAEAAEARAGVLEEQSKALKQVADNAALTARQQQQKADEIAKQTDAAVAAIGELSPDQAKQDIHDRLVRLGLLRP